ncbi:Etk tyrosine kinase [Bombiscardovia nodaiensis]|uniref:Etk tyrosine kinase n=1 Tax=Bombiscardovia nodaiensis TaxID=2932181 RepID=A0ABM8B927_9BIFI|nr:Etk tyrosine kinase [Bombiscardovia nodaiensis]
MQKSSVFRQLRKQSVAALVTFIVAFAVVVIYTITRPPEYTATAQLVASYKGNPNSTSPGEANSGMTFVHTQMNSYPQLVKTESVLKPVIRDLDLDTTVEDLADHVSLTNPRGTFIINISVDSRKRQEAADIANSVAQQLTWLTSSQQFRTGKISAQLKTVQRAELPTSPSSPKIPVYLLAGLLLSAGLAILVAALMRVPNEKVGTEGVAKELIKAPLLGELKSELYAGNPELPIIDDPQSKEASTYRYIKANLVSLAGRNTKVGTEGRIFVFTSAQEGAMSSLASINIAASLADEDKRVLLIDANTQQSSIAERLGLSNTLGLSDVLTGETELDNAVQRFDKSNMYILPTGTHQFESALSNRSVFMSDMFDKIELLYDYVIINTAPLLEEKAAPVLGNLADGFVILAADNTRKKSLIRTVTEIRNGQTPVVGFIFGKVSTI